ncbi:MAG: sigma-54 dependent transcriptional regulator [Thermodesulfobacteriota bacterium]
MKKKPAEILVVEDSEDCLSSLVTLIEFEGYVARPASNAARALEAARQSPPDLILLDIGLPDMDGCQACAQLKADPRTRDISIIFLSGLYETADKIRAFEAGGVDYITKPYQFEEIKARIKTHLTLREMQTALQEQNLRLQEEARVRQAAQEALREAHDQLEKRVAERTRELQQANVRLRKAVHEIQRLKDRLQQENIYLQGQLRDQQGHPKILGDSPRTRETLRQIEQVAKTDATVLIVGETGTGKELVAQTIHERSARGNRAMVTVNCAALPDGIVESEFFGRAKGAYTGASTDQAGRFEVADGSTIFLDEIGELRPELQAKLLRVLQDGSFERLGSAKTTVVDVRVIAATNRDLERAVQDGKFRQDLYYRLCVFPIVVPPLRKRVDDIPALAAHFIERFAARMGRSVPRIDPATMQDMKDYRWPGNVRELANIIERAMIISGPDILEVALPDTSEIDFTATLDLHDTERRHIIRVLETTNWRIKGKGGAAEILGLKPTTLQSKMKKLGIERTSPPSSTEEKP